MDSRLRTTVQYIISVCMLYTVLTKSCPCPHQDAVAINALTDSVVDMICCCCRYELCYDLGLTCGE